jgi:phospholipase/lecithinase/hemolysin
MPKIYNEDQLRRVWVAIHDEDQRRSEVAKVHNTSTDEVDKMYEAARKRFGTAAARRIYTGTLPESLKRPSAEYSNKSAYGIASPGLFD